MRVLLIALVAVGVPGAAQAQAGSPPDAGQLFEARCGMCHLGGGPGVMTLTKRLGKEKSLIAERTDLDPVYVKFVVRRGLRAMPPLGRVEVTDAQLDDIAAYLTRHHAPGAP